MGAPLFLSVAYATAIWLLWRLWSRNFLLRSPLEQVSGPARSSFLVGGLEAFLAMLCMLTYCAGHLHQFFTDLSFRDHLGDDYDGIARIDGPLGVRSQQHQE